MKFKKSGYWLTRFVFLRLLGLVYVFAFLSLVHQVLGLIGSNGLTPTELYLERVRVANDNPFLTLPSLFWFDHSDTALIIGAWIGVVLSLVVLFGFANMPLMIVLWFLYMSYVHIGQLWYSFGWEIQLLETGFLAIFVVPFWDARPFPKTPPPTPIVWLLRWLTFRIMLGAGLIKLRGDECWRDLTCMVHHYETQPIPNPLSRYFHFLPVWFHKIEVLVNHLVEVVAAFFVFGPRIARHLAGGLWVLFQFVLILSGNLSFLNWLTITAAIGCFDDSLLSKILPKKLVRCAKKAKRESVKSKPHTILSWIVFVGIILLSFPVVSNLFFSDRQIMNTSFNSLHLVNTYGAFGSVGKDRLELVVQGTTDTVLSDQTEWKEYEFKAKPTSLDRSPPVVAPYHLRLDWLVWFAAMSSYERYPWMVHLVWKFLHNDPTTLKLIESNPFPDQPPTYVRVEWYRYKFAPLGEDQIWQRERIGTWLPPLHKNDPTLIGFMQSQGWK